MKELTKQTRMKPIREYLQELPTPYNTLALSVVDENFYAYKAEVQTLYDAVSLMCAWRITPQGYGFWNNVSNWAIDHNTHQLPPIPAVEVSPELEQTNNLLGIGKTFNTLLEQLNSLIQENVSLSDGNALYQDKIKDLEQENTELRAKLAELLSNPKEL
jgi:hypothetical protein